MGFDQQSWIEVSRTNSCRIHMHTYALVHTACLVLLPVSNAMSQHRQAQARRCVNEDFCIVQWRLRVGWGGATPLVVQLAAKIFSLHTKGPNLAMKEAESLKKRALRLSNRHSISTSLYCCNEQSCHVLVL